MHGVNTQNTGYADVLIRKIKKSIFIQKGEVSANFYSSFWGNIFNNKKHQVIGCIEQDYARACNKHSHNFLFRESVYKFQQHRKQLINNFLGDFLIYQNPIRGKAIRETIYGQLEQFLNDHDGKEEIHFIAHSLGSIILWDLLFSDYSSHIEEQDPAYLFRKKVSEFNLSSITTLGSPMLFLKQMLDLDFSAINLYLSKISQVDNRKTKRLRWVNIIHPSDMIAYPLSSAIEDETNSNLLFFDQYVCQNANIAEKLIGWTNSDLGMIVAAQDAHASYFADNINGSITAKIAAYNILGKTSILANRCVYSK